MLIPFLSWIPVCFIYAQTWCMRRWVVAVAASSLCLPSGARRSCCSSLTNTGRPIQRCTISPSISHRRWPRSVRTCFMCATLFHFFFSTASLSFCQTFQLMHVHTYIFLFTSHFLCFWNCWAHSWSDTTHFSLLWLLLYSDIFHVLCSIFICNYQACVCIAPTSIWWMIESKPR